MGFSGRLQFFGSIQELSNGVMQLK